MDPPPLPFQLQNPERVRQEFTKAGLKDARVETTTETMEFQTSQQLWDWLVSSNPIVERTLGEAKLTPEQTAVVQDAMEKMVRERAGDSGIAKFTSPINIGIGTK